MLAAVIIIVACLFFLGLGLLISTNTLVVLIFAAIGLMLGSLAGVLILRGGPMKSQEHWAIFVGPLISGMFFVMLCGILNLLVQDAVDYQLGGVRMFSVSFLLGTAPGLIIGWLLGVNLGGQRTTHSRPGTGMSGSQPTLWEQRQAGGYSGPTGQLVDQSPSSGSYAGQPAWATNQSGMQNQQRGYAGPPRTTPLGPPDPFSGSGNTSGGWQPMTGATIPQSSGAPGSFGGEWNQGNAMLLDQLSQEQASLSRYGHVQLLDPHDGTLCVVVFLNDGQNIIYLVCPPNYPQQQPMVTVESGGSQRNVGPGILFPWNSSQHRLEHIVADLMQRL